MTTLRRTVSMEVSLPVSGEDLADLFWEMSADSQAHFFNSLPTFPRLVFQLQAVTDSPVLNFDGRYAMAKIGEYAEPSTK